MKYKHLIEVLDIDAANAKIGPHNSYDLIETRKNRTVNDRGEFTDKITYVLGEKYQDEDILT